MNKTALLHLIVEALRRESASFLETSKKTRATGNDPQTKAEGKYDTRSIEENYLADGQARQALAAMQAAAILENLTPRPFADSEAIDLGALIEMEFPAEKIWFFLGPAGGGQEIVSEGKTITVITPESPLGRQLIGLKIGGWSKAPQAKVLRVL